ncbi:MAG: hypothetical protein EA382_01075 [Spirochaetaceae bacterium]|nr:MAG: hypothetical protein EA382_01075 [Spirochaetaceae bacterium]
MRGIDAAHARRPTSLDDVRTLGLNAARAESGVAVHELGTRPVDQVTRPAHQEPGTVVGSVGVKIPGIVQPYPESPGQRNRGRGRTGRPGAGSPYSRDRRIDAARRIHGNWPREVLTVRTVFDNLSLFGLWWPNWRLRDA